MQAQKRLNRVGSVVVLVLGVLTLASAPAQARKAYVLSPVVAPTNAVPVIDTSTNAVTHLDLPGIESYQYTTAVAVSPDGRRAYFGVATAWWVPPDGGPPPHVRVLDIGQDPPAVAGTPGTEWAIVAGITPDPTGARFYVARGSSNGGIWAFDSTTNERLGAVGDPSNTFVVGALPDGSRLLLGDTIGGTLSVVDSGAYRATSDPIPVGGHPYAGAITPDGAYAYVTNLGPSYEGPYTVSVIDTAINAVVRTIPVGSRPMAIAITPDGSRAYIGNSGERSVSVIDTSTYEVVATIGDVGQSPYGVAITPDGKRAYVANRGDDTVAVIDTATNEVVERLTDVGLATSDIAIVPNQGPSLDRVTATPASAGQPTTLEAQGASDSDGYVASYRWDFGDGSPVETTDDPTTTHVYATAGTYTATATAVDSEGGADGIVTDGRAVYHNGTDAARKQVSVSVGATDTATAEQGATNTACVRMLTAGQPASVTRWTWSDDEIYYRLKAAPGARSSGRVDVTLQTRRKTRRAKFPSEVKFSFDDGQATRTDRKRPYKVALPAELATVGRHRVEATVYTPDEAAHTLALSVYVSRCEESALSVSMRGKVPGSKTGIEFGAQTANQEPLSAATLKLPKLLRVNTRRAERRPIGTLQLLDDSGAIKFSRPLMLVRQGRRTFELAGKGNGPKATLARSRPGYTVSLSGLGRFEAPRVRLALFGRGNGFLRNASSCRRYLYRAVLTTTDGQTHQLKRGLRMCKGRPGTG